MRTHTITTIIVAAALAAPRIAAASGVVHQPPAEATAGQAIELSAGVARADQRTLFLHYRAVGAGQWTLVEFTRSAHGDDWIASVPATAVAPPGVEYFIASTVAGGGEVDEFASATAPHQVGVYASAREERRARDVARSNFRHSRFRVAGEYVSYGSRDSGGVSVGDGYYRVDADFSYRLLTYPLEEIRFGYTRMEGKVPDEPRDAPTACATGVTTPGCRVDAGFKVGGWFELGLGITEGIRFDARGMFMANQEGFALGGRGELRSGVADGNHVALGVEYLALVGTTGYFRLGWHTVPAVPMAATIEVTDLPATVRATGVRLVYDAFFPLDNGLRLGLRVGYAARDQQVGGPTAGLSASFDF